MDFNSILKTITSSDSISQLSSLSGTSEKDVASILSSALPQLLSGAKAQATNKDTAQSFASALQSHSKTDSNDLTSFLGGVDLDDGQKIVNHLLGKDNAAAAAENLSAQSGVSASSITSILSAAAPLMMNLMGKQASDSTETSSDDASGSALAGIVGSLFGSSDDTKSESGLGGILSGLSGLFK